VCKFNNYGFFNGSRIREEKRREEKRREER